MAKWSQLASYLHTEEAVSVKTEQTHRFVVVAPPVIKLKFPDDFPSSIFQK
jgi:hypothetical protein